MQLFFEEDGVFKAGAVLKQDGNAYQVELPTGRRTKVKGGHVLFEFESPAAAQFLEKAQAEAASLDPQFLWEVAPQDEFTYDSLAQDYYSQPSAVQKAAILMALHANPVYFYRKGRGNYKRASQEILQRALEAIVKRKKMEARRDEMRDDMEAGKLPPEIASKPFELLLKPDKNSMEWKALEAAANALKKSPLRLMLDLKAIKSPYCWHVGSFYAQSFPNGTEFPVSLPAPQPFDRELPVANVRAFSIDDSSTNEVDDAASVTDLGDGRSRIGIHIAAPGLRILRGDCVDQVARSRMSTVYAPGLKTTMLPPQWILACSLDEGQTVPCVSLYATVDNNTMEVLSSETRVEKVPMAANLRYDKFPPITEQTMLDHALTIPFAKEIEFLWRFGKARQKIREEVSGRPEPKGRVDWSFELEGEGEDAVVHIKGRKRGEPIDLLVAELMIFANSTWGLWLEEHGTAGIYRSQRMGRVKMSTVPGPHDGLGVERYAWSTSPLRRYVDMVNQRQIAATALGETPPYKGNDADFFTIVSQFEAIYDAYNDFQRTMERYWSLRWIMQEKISTIDAVVVKDDLVRLDGLPMLQRMPGMQEIERGRKVRLGIIGCDLVDLVLEARVLEVLRDKESSEDLEADSLGLPEENETKAQPVPQGAGDPSAASVQQEKD